MKSAYKIFMVCLICLSTLKGYSQGCPTSGYPDYYNCSDIAQFVIDYPSCSCLPNSLRLPYGGTSDLAGFPGLAQLDSISGNLFCNECDLSSLVGLENLTYVGGHITIDEPHGTLVNLQGLNNVSYIGEALSLKECGDLLSTHGLDNLQYVGSINIYECDELIEIVGFEDISEIPGSINLEENYALPNLSGFSNFSTVGGDINIDEMDGLHSLEGLENIDAIGGNLIIRKNPILENLDALSSVISIGTNINLWSNTSLNSLEGLFSVVEFNGEILVYNCESLTSLYGLENIEEQNITYLTIMNCENLNYCSLDNICSYITNDFGPSTIELNDGGCNSENEITDMCALVEINDTITESAFEKQLVLITDLLGRETTLKPNTPLLYIYEDNTVEKKIILE